MKNSDDVCAYCGEQFHQGQRYFAGPTKEHVMCRKFKDVSQELGTALHDKHTLQDRLKARK